MNSRSCVSELALLRYDSPSATAMEREPFRRALPVRVLADLVLLQLLVQIAARRADHFGRLRDVPAVLAQLADEEHPLRVFLELPQRAHFRRIVVAGRLRRDRPT